MDPTRQRNYETVLNALPAEIRRLDREARMNAVVDSLWAELGPKGCSWVGFYLKFPDSDEMVLGPRRDKPACSPIGMYGACGRSFLSRRPLVVTNVANLRAGYVACDPRDRSEVVVPLMDAVDDLCWGVLDADSHDVHSFSEADVLGLQRVLEHAGLTVAGTWLGQIETV